MSLINPIREINRTSPRVAEGATFLYESDLVKEDGTAISSSDLVSLVLEIVDTDTGDSVLSETDVLNVDRGTVDSEGHLTIAGTADDTALSGKKAGKRSLKFTWVYNTDRVGRHQYDFWVVALSGDP